MPTFNYKATTTEGKTTEGQTDAADKFDLVKTLKSRGLTVIFAREEKKSEWNMKRLNLIVASVKLREKIVFARNLGSMIEAGIALSRALEILERQTKNPKMRDVLHSVSEDIKNGGTLSEGMKKFPNVFSQLFIAMVHAGEESGQLVETLGVVGKQLEQSYTLRKKIKGAMMYPSIVLLAMLIIGILMFIYVVPTLTGTFKEFDIELPMSTKIIMGLSDFLVAHTITAIGALAGIFAGVYFGLKTKVGQRVSDFLVLRIPIISGIVKQYNSAQTARTLSSLFASGVSVVEALTITEEVLQNSYYKAVLLKAQDVVQKGVPLSSVFAENERIYPALVSEMMMVGEETGKLSDMLEKIAVFYEEEVDTVTKDLSTIIEPFLMLFIASGVGFFAVSMIAPMYKLTASI